VILVISFIHKCSRKGKWSILSTRPSPIGWYSVACDNRSRRMWLGLSLLCSKFYLLFLPEFPKKILPLFFFYSCIQLIILIIMLILVSIAKWSDCSIRVFERSIRVYQSFRGISALISRRSCLNVRNIIFFVAQPFLLANQKEEHPLIPLIIPIDVL